MGGHRKLVLIGALCTLVSVQSPASAQEYLRALAIPPAPSEQGRQASAFGNMAIGQDGKVYFAMECHEAGSAAANGWLYAYDPKTDKIRLLTDMRSLHPERRPWTAKLHADLVCLPSGTIAMATMSQISKTSRHYQQYPGGSLCLWDPKTDKGQWVKVMTPKDSATTLHHDRKTNCLVGIVEVEKQIFKYDLEKGTTTFCEEAVGIPRAPRELAVPQTGFAYSSLEEQGLGEYDIAGNTMKKYPDVRMTGEMRSVRFLHDGRCIISTKAGIFYRADLRTPGKPQVEELCKSRCDPSAIALTLNDKKVYFINGEHDERHPTFLEELDLESKSIRRLSKMTLNGKTNLRNCYSVHTGKDGKIYMVTFDPDFAFWVLDPSKVPGNTVAVLQPPPAPAK